MIVTSLGERCADYAGYLMSEHWRRMKAKILNERWACQRCYKTGSLQVHHLTYERIGHEEDGDLVVLCSACHRFVHGKRIRR